MAREPMVRKQLYILPCQAEMLKEQAARYNVSEGELVRRALDKHLSTAGTETPQLNLSGWHEELRFIEHRRNRLRNLRKTPQGRKWKRDDLYER